MSDPITESDRHEYVGFGDEPNLCKICSQGEKHPNHNPESDSASAQEPEEWTTLIQDILKYVWIQDVFGKKVLIHNPEKIAELINAALLGASPISQTQELEEWRHEVAHQAGHNEEHWYRINSFPSGKFIACVRGFDNACSICENFNTALSSLREKVKALETALEFYADKKYWFLFDLETGDRQGPCMGFDRGDDKPWLTALRAISVLESNENQPTSLLTKDAEILALRAELQEAEKALKFTEGAMIRLEAKLDILSQPSEMTICRQTKDCCSSALQLLELKEPNSGDVNVETQKDALYDFAPWVPPFSYESNGSRIIDARERIILDVRGWGFLTGLGSEALGLDLIKAEDIQDRLGEFVTKLLNSTWVVKPNVAGAPPVNQKEETPLEKARRHAQDGPTLLDAKWLDPACWDGCQSLGFKHKLEAVESRLQIQTEALKQINHVCMSDKAVDADTIISRVNRRAVNALAASEAVDPKRIAKRA